MKHAHERVKKLAGMEDSDITDLGKMAIHGVVTVAEVGIAANVMGGIVGSFPKQPELLF